MAKEICHDNISYVATQRIENIRGAMSRQKTACRDKKWEECNKSVATKKVNVVTMFVSWMSTSGNLSRHKSLCRDKGSRKKAEIMSRQEIKEHYRKNIATDQFIL